MTMPLRFGVHADLEAAADAMIKQSLAGVTRHVDKSDILTPWKEQERRRREVYVPSGTPDSSNREGIFHRVTNPGSPHLNSRGRGTARGSRLGAARINAEENWDGSMMLATTMPTISWDSE
jgi:hypothetical protein